MNREWIPDARRHLLELRDSQTSSWRYSATTNPAVEPTALSSLALWNDADQNEDSRQSAVQAADWLAAIQNTDGSLGPTAAQTKPGWPTPYGVWVWACQGRHAESREKAIQWILNHKGKALPKSADNVSSHDTTIPGWAWLDGAHGWIEPTALALIALRSAGQANHPRCQEGLELILDRALPSGGWNYGNAVVFGKELRPQPASTGLALTALAGLVTQNPSISRALDYLKATFPNTRAAQSLGWGLIGLTAWGRRPEQADSWLNEACQANLSRSDAAMRLAMLLIAANPQFPVPTQSLTNKEKSHD